MPVLDIFITAQPLYVPAKSSTKNDTPDQCNHTIEEEGAPDVKSVPKRPVRPRRRSSRLNPEEWVL
jgi:hypothetical protein